MAFQQPQRHQVRPRSYSSNLAEPLTTTAPLASQPQRQSPRQTAHDWIVFSPAAPSDTYDRTDSTVRTDRITGQLSDFGSLETTGVSEKPRQATTDDKQLHIDREPPEPEQDLGETEDADSLDDGLHAFNEPSLDSDQRAYIDQNGDSVLPTHDGLGMFPGNSSPVQEQFWQHEKYNPRRRRQSRRRSSLQRRFDALEEQIPLASEEDKIQRIEKWRIEQSQAILEEIERETRRRRRRKSRANANADTGDQKSTVSSVKSSETMQSKPASATATATATTQTTPHQRLSFWERLTRSVIRNLIGIDDATLEFIFGESLPSDAQSTNKPSPAAEFIDYAERTIPDDNALASSTESWEQSLLARISKELGILLGHISEHPGAFTSYLRTQETPSYAGITPSNVSLAVQNNSGLNATPTTSNVKSSVATPSFGPTLLNQSHHRTPQHHQRQSLNTTDPSLWGIEEVDEDSPAATNPAPLSDEAARLQREREYWERDLDAKMVFGFLRDRFSSPTSNAPPAQSQPQENRQYAQPRASSRNFHQNITSALSTLPAHSAANANSLRRAALIRHHHPLVSRNVSASSQNSQAQSRARALSSGAPLSPVLGRRPSYAAETDSCASQSTKRSKTAHSGSSRNYWDIGGSAGGGASFGGASLGWGEVL